MHSGIEEGVGAEYGEAAVPRVPPVPHVRVPELLTPEPPRVDERIAERLAAVPVVF